MAHSCDWCSWTEIDSRFKIKDLPDDRLAITFRGPKVFQASAAGCSFFTDMLLNSWLKHGEVNDAKNWRYEIDFYLRGNDLYRATGTWICADGDKKHTKKYGVLAEPDDPAAKWIYYRPLHLDPKADSSIRWINTTLDECTSLHSECTPRKADVKPARLLQIMAGGMQQKLRLCPATGEERYAAVSYCWGDVVQNTLTGPLLRKWSTDSGLAISELPASLVDALVIARRIGVEFIWIDSLCIIQSDPEEKATEISKMAAIFEGAFITISAGSAERCTDGFLHHIIRPNLQPGGSFKLPYICHDGVLGSIILCPNESWWLGDPIDRRAWTMQEHILSRRVIRFGVLGIQWTCGATTKFLPDPGIGEFGHRYHNLHAFHRVAQDIQNGSDHSLSFWTIVLELFSHKRNLTNSEDHLPALAGISTRWGELSKDTYLAGIWLSHIPQGLLWTQASPFGARQKNHSAPSWSWASLEYPNLDNFYFHLPVDENFKLLSHQIILEFDQLPYGKVKKGSLMIRGKIIQMAWKPSEDTLSACHVDHGYMNPEFVSLDMDVIHDLPESEEPRDVWLLQLVLFDEWTRCGPAGLVLEKDTSGEYRRLGLYLYDHKRTLDSIANSDWDGYLQKVWHFGEAMIKEQRKNLSQVEATTLTIV